MRILNWFKSFDLKSDEIPEVFIEDGIKPVVEIYPLPVHIKEITATSITTPVDCYLYGLSITGRNTVAEAATTIGFSIGRSGYLSIYWKIAIIPNAANVVHGEFSFAKPLFLPQGSTLQVVSDVAAASKIGYAILSEHF